MSRTAKEIADDLIGYCGGSRPQVEEEIEYLSIEEIAEFDRLAFLCDVCGWWCAEEEMCRHDDICNECDEHDEEEDDDG